MRWNRLFLPLVKEEIRVLATGALDGGRSEHFLLAIQFRWGNETNQ
jgi:hypothetical protein